MSINTEWFRERLAQKRISARLLSKRLGLDAAAVSLMLRGKRRMSLDEANKVAEELDVSVTEVLRQAGIQVQQDATLVNLVGWINGDSAVFEIKAMDQLSVVAPADVPGNGCALQVQDPNSFYDRWLVFCGPQVPSVELLIDQLCVLHLGESIIIGHLKRGYKKGTHSIIKLVHRGTPQILSDCFVSVAAPVLWLKPQ
jgi:transcriptional regulator with XRE-family HTH domain